MTEGCEMCATFGLPCPGVHAVGLLDMLAEAEQHIHCARRAMPDERGPHLNEAREWIQLACVLDARTQSQFVDSAGHAAEFVDVEEML